MKYFMFLTALIFATGTVDVSSHTTSLAQEEEEDKGGRPVSKGVSFYGVDLFTITMFVQRITGKQFIFSKYSIDDGKGQPAARATQEDLQDNVIYFLSDEDYTKKPEVFFKIYESLLEQAGFTLLPVVVDKEKDVEIYKILKVRDMVGGRPGRLRQDMLREKPFPVDTGDEIEVRERVITRLFKLEYANPRDMVNQLTQSGFASSSIIVPFDQEKTLMITDYDYNVKKFAEIIKLIDAKPEIPLVEVIELKYTLATNVAEVLNQMLPMLQPEADVTGVAGGGRGRGGIPAQPGQPPQISYGTEEAVFPDTRTNSVIIVASKERMDLIRNIIIEDLDVDKPDQETVGIYIHPLIYVRADDAAQIIGQAMAGYLGEQQVQGLDGGASGGALGGGRGGAGGGGRLGGGRTTPFGGGTGSLGGARQPPGTRGQTQSGLGTELTPPGLGQPVIGESFRVIPDLRTNTLIIITDRITYGLMKEKLLSTLDKRAPQIVLKVTAVEITSNKDFDLGVELKRLVSEREGKFRFQYSHQFGLSTVQPPTDEDPTVNVVPAFQNNGITAFVIKDRLGKIPFLLQALETRANGSIIVEQELLTQNNQPATFTDERSTSVPITQIQNVGGQPVQQTEPLEVFATTTLTITPRISETMEVDLNVQFSTERFGQSPGPNLPPDTTRRDIQIENIRIPNTQTVVLGGAASQQKGKRVSKIPLLGDIPILGYLFRRTQTTDQVSRVYLFVTPYILYDERIGDLVDLTKMREELLKKVQEDIDVMEYPQLQIDFTTSYRFKIPYGDE